MKTKEILDRKFESLKPGELKEGIKEKFKTISRFYRIAYKDSDKSYRDVISILSGRDAQAQMDIYLLARSTDDMPLDDELTSDQKFKIRLELIGHISPPLSKTIKTFCEENGFNPTWMSRLLSDKDYSATRINSPNLKRLLKILNLEL